MQQIGLIHREIDEYFSQLTEQMFILQWLVIHVSYFACGDGHEISFI